MLSISAMRAGQEGYYLGLAQEDYYLLGGEPEGRWHGTGARELALSGAVQAEHLRNLMAGRSPCGNYALVQAQRLDRRQPGWDLTFSAPKSVSVLWAVAGEGLRAAIQEAHDAAVRDSLDYLEQTAAWTRRGRRGATMEPCKPVVAVFQHGTSREQEPQLHSHALWQNCATRDDGTVGTISSRELYTHQMAGGAIYRSSLDFRLQALGLETERDRFAFRVKGVPGELCLHFSTRRQQIEQYLRAVDGGYSARLAEHAAVLTRSSKGHVARGALFEFWRTECDKLSFSRSLAESLVHPHRERDWDLVAEHKALSNILDEAIEELAATRGYFSDCDVIREVVPRLYGKNIHSENLLPLLDVKLAEPANIYVLQDRPGRRLYSTPEHMDLEGRLSDTAAELAQNTIHKLPESSIQWGYEKFPSLSQEQFLAHAYVTQDTGGLAIVDGLPGTGKTYFLNAVRESYEAHGYRVIGTAVSRKAATELSEGAQIEADSVFGLRRKLESGFSDQVAHEAEMMGRALIGKGRWNLTTDKLDSKTVLIVDEATMLNTADANYLLGKAKEAGAKVILVGGTNQLPAIGPGGAFEHLKGVYGAAELTGIIRQENEWEREAIKQLYQGDLQGALSQYADNGRLAIGETRAQSIDGLLDAWHDGRTEDARETVVLAHTNEDVRELNERIQAQRKYRGELGWRWATVSGQTVHPGDVVMFQSNFTANDARNPSERVKVNNGDTALVRNIKVVGINRGEVEVEVELRRKKPTLMPIKRVLGIPEDYIRVKFLTKDKVDLSLGYASTVHKVQGGTFEKAFVLGGGAMTSLESTFVAMSRAKKETTLYLSKEEAGEDLEQFMEEASRSRTKPMAKELDHNVNAQRQQERSDMDAEIERVLQERVRAEQARQEQERQHEQRPAPPMDRGMGR